MSYINHFNHQILGTGNRRKMVFLHGLMGFASNWKPIANNFINEYEVLIYDQRGHGRSFQPEEGYSTVDYAQDLDKILKELGWEKVILIGHSMGGRVAVEFATQFPESIDRLVIVDIGPESDQASMQAVEEKLHFVPTPFASREQARDFFDGPFLQKFPNEMVKKFFYANLHKNERGDLDWKFSREGVLETLRLARTGEQWAQFEELAVPCLLMRGQSSKDLPLVLYEAVLARNTRIEGVVVEGAGHWVHVDQPKEVIEIIAGFING